MKSAIWIAVVIAASVGLVVLDRSNPPVTKDTICADGFPAQAQSWSKERYDENGNVLWGPNEPLPFYRCP